MTTIPRSHDPTIPRSQGPTIPRSHDPTIPRSQGPTIPRSQRLARRNLFTALALVFTASTFIPYVQEERIGWFMWRDAPILAITFIALAATMVVGWLRTHRN
jgi:hypothetical protein